MVPEIEYAVPIPKAAMGRKPGRMSLYNFHLLTVGSSMFYPGERFTSDCVLRAAVKFAARNGWKLKTRALEGGRRVWRLA